MFKVKIFVISAFLSGKAFKLVKISFFIIFFILTGVFVYSTESLEDIEKIADKYLDNYEDIETVLEACRDALIKEIPLKFISPRINEGLSKNVSPALIAAVIRNEIADFSKASEIIKKIEGGGKFFSQDKLWQRSAILLSSDMPENILSRLIEINTDDSSRFIPVTDLYLSLAKWGLSPANAMLVSEAALKSNLEENEYRDIVSLFTKGRRMHLTSGKLIKRILDELPGVRSLRQLEKRIFR